MEYITPEDAVGHVVQYKTEAILLLDFDGVLSPIVPHANDAYISSVAQDALRILQAHMPIGIVSGRSVNDVRARAGLPDAAYSGSHGFEMLVHGEYTHHVSPEALAALQKVRAALESVADGFQGAYVESKEFGVALHYRSVALEQEDALRRAAAQAVSAFEHDGTIRVIDNKKTFDVGPSGAIDKGSAVRMLINTLGTGVEPFPIYIGDSATDEDAFRALADGLTIRVEYEEGSAARYHFRNREEVDKFLGMLAQKVEQHNTERL